MKKKTKRKVLIVDDDPMICEYLKKEILRNFLSASIANNSMEALKILSRERIDIVVVDFHIPGMDGLRLLKKIKNKWKNCEVIIITGFGSQKVAIQALQYGAIDYLEKPIKIDELNTSIGRALEKIAEKEELIYRNTVLIVDDDEGFNQKLERVLKKEGYSIFTAYNGNTGLEIITNNKIDIILTDINMPGIDGIKLLERAKKIYKDVEVIMMTGYEDEEMAVNALRRGAINYLRKPIDLEELCIAIDKAIEKITLFRNQLYRNRELKINTEIISKMNEELETRVRDRTQKLSQTQSQLFQTSKLATLGEMSTGLAHELNQPLTGISLIAANIRMLIDRKLLKEEEINEAVEDIEKNVTRMSNIINHIRTFARQDTLKSIDMDINDSIQGALSLLGEQLRLRNIKIVKKFSNNLPMIKGEPHQIEQVAINIITNARDALSENDQEEKDKIKDRPNKLIIETINQKNIKGDMVCLSIADNGIGMSSSTKQKMFDPFFTTKEVGKGTGLGMSISYGIVQSFNGTIDVKSKKGKGTTVSVKFPIAAKAG
ncbi:MAG TPA: hybrid sensor histidine kinase/response regulator [Actinobacteria bacterium]|nr:hybrid sensor histidine kinase/response regulator [Actinomycetota bacterium]